MFKYMSLHPPFHRTTTETNGNDMYCNIYIYIYIHMCYNHHGINKKLISETTPASEWKLSQSVVSSSDVLGSGEWKICWWVSFRSWVTFDSTHVFSWRSLTWDCNEDEPEESLQVWRPSSHVWATFAFSALPQFLYHAPPGAQQLRLPDFLMVPHLEHARLTVVVEPTSGNRWGWVWRRVWKWGRGLGWFGVTV